jgi:hypothetical protein
MDLRKKININPYRDINIPLGQPYEIDDEDGNTSIEYATTDRTTLAFLIKEAKRMGIDESEYMNVHVKIYYDCCDPSLCVFHRKNKSQKEIDKEFAEEQNAREKALEEKERRKQEKLNKKKEKQRIIDSLTPAQKKALGYK